MTHDDRIGEPVTVPAAEPLVEDVPLFDDTGSPAVHPDDPEAPPTSRHVPTPRDDRRPSVDRDVARVGRHHPDTAVAAAARALPKTGTMRRITYDHLVAVGDHGATDHELEVHFGRTHQSMSACRNSLMRDGWVTDSGRRRPLPNGNKAIVWVAVI